MTARSPLPTNASVGSTEIPETEKGADLAAFIESTREDLEALAGEDYPISPLVQALLDRHDRGER